MEMGHREGTKQSGSAKSKKGMLKKLSYEFSSPSDLEKKKSKFLKKKLKEKRSNNGVDHASVPRKLRSAMKKRNLESVSKLSTGSKRLNRSKTGIESLKKDFIKKENQEMETKDIVVTESMMISKDEKEVAETLYGLAGMFTEISSIDKKSCDSFSDEKETSKVESILVAETDLVKAEMLQPGVSVLSSAKTKLIDEMPLQQSDKQNNSTRMVDFLDRLKQSNSANMTYESAGPSETNVSTSDMDYKSNGLALWPGLSSTVQSSSHVLSNRPSSTNLPPWMGQAVVSPAKNASRLSENLRVQPRKLKRCASHIYICRLIKALQSSNYSPVRQNQIEQSSEMSELRLPEPVTTSSEFKNMVSSSKRYQNPNLHDKHRTPHSKAVQEDRTQLALELYGPHTSQKPSFDFLSLSTTGAAQSHFQLPNSFPQYHNSPAYNIQHSPTTSSHQVQQISPYLASRFQTAYNANQQQQHQLQKRLWAAQYRPQTSGNSAPSSNQYSIKPNLSLNLTNVQPLHVASSPRYNNSVSQQQHRLMAAAAAMSMNHHHHQKNPSRAVMNRQEHHFPLIYEDTRTPLQLLCKEQT